jgi:hypothetical protein
MTGEVQVGSKREILTPSTYFPLRLGQRTCGAYTAMTVSCQPGGALRLGSRYGSSAIDPLRCAITSSCRAFRNIVSRSFPSGVDLARSVRRSTSCANRCPKLDNASSLRSIACPHRRMFRNICVKVQLSVSVFHVLFRAEMVRHIDLNQTMPLRPKMDQGATGHECGSIRTWPVSQRGPVRVKNALPRSEIRLQLYPQDHTTDRAGHVGFVANSGSELPHSNIGDPWRAIQAFCCFGDFSMSLNSGINDKGPRNLRTKDIQRGRHYPLLVNPRACSWTRRI